MTRWRDPSCCRLAEYASGLTRTYCIAHSVGTRFRPLGCKIPDPLEFQAGSPAPSDYRYPFPLLARQDHRSRYRGAQLHCAVICQGNKLFRVKGHFRAPTLTAGSISQLRCPDGNAEEHWLAAQREVLNASLGKFGRVSITEPSAPRKSAKQRNAKSKKSPVAA